MRLLLDSHAFLWFSIDSPRLSRRAKDAIDAAQEVRLSYASIWEMAIKQAIGRLKLQQEPEGMAERLGVDLLGIELPHLRRLPQLPSHHGDPFDRMLIAQAIEEGLTLVTADALVQRYPVAWLW